MKSEISNLKSEIDPPAPWWVEVTFTTLGLAAWCVFARLAFTIF